MWPEKFRQRLGVLARLAALIGVSCATASPATGEDMGVSAAPTEWVRYASGATDAITGWLQADSATAARFRSYLDQTRPDAEGPTPPLLLKIWVDGDGAVSRIIFAPFAHPEPNADLRALVADGRLPGKPPKDMLQPLRIAIQLGSYTEGNGRPE